MKAVPKLDESENGQMFFFFSEMQLICSVHIMNPQIRQPAESDEQNLVLTNLTMTEMINLL